MTEEQDRITIPFIELMHHLIEDAVKRGEIPPGVNITIISKDALPEDEENMACTKGEVTEICEPVSERHENGSIVTITVDLPGTTMEDIRHTLHREALYLAAHANTIIYRASYPIRDAAAETLTHTFKNGVIEFTYTKKDQIHG